MKSIAGAIVVLAGSLIMGLASDKIPTLAVPTVSSIALIVIGLIVIFTDTKPGLHDKKD